METMENIINILKSRNQNDMWNELYAEQKISCNKPISVSDGQEEVLRLLGPFLSLQRTYLQKGILGHMISVDDLKGVLKQDMSIIEKIWSKVYEQHPELKPGHKYKYNYKRHYKDLERNLHQLLEQSHWKDCILSNALYRKQPEIGVLCINKKSPVWSSLQEECSRINRGYDGIPISGYIAHDLILQNQARVNAKFPEYNIKLCNEKSKLSVHELDFILNIGLIDLQKIIKKWNRKTVNYQSGYLYVMPSSYRMPDEYLSDITKSWNIEQENKHLEMIEHSKDDLPLELFENAIDTNSDALAGVEID